jgi:hypothetical protein
MFSAADYRPSRDYAVVKAILDDCYIAGIPVKVITKVTQFIHDFHSHPAVRVIHLSVDSIGSGVPLKTAIGYRQSYSKVLVRCVALNHADVKRFGRMKSIDIITLNHGRNGFHNFRKRERAEIADRYAGRVCCSSGKCESCPIKCGDPAKK